MTALHIYRQLLKLHPRRFRERFGPEMLSIFEERTRSRSAIPLLFDGAASVVRQWWVVWHTPEPAVLWTPSELRARSQSMYVVAMSLTVLWLCGMLGSSLLALPGTSLFWVWIGIDSVNRLGRYYLRRKRQDESDRRTRLLARHERMTRRIFGRTIWEETIMVSVLLLVNPAAILAIDFVKLGITPRLLGSLAVWATLSCLWLVLLRMKSRAAAAIQQELDALPDSSSSSE